ncbi:MAG: BamA/TamA family outer membrane protein, partial [Sphingomonadaceae bacterium]|nr:BamA/TamA family outer membrane protein [Sphingomonadaceae bacterium]
MKRCSVGGLAVALGLGHAAAAGAEVTPAPATQAPAPPPPAVRAPSSASPATQAPAARADGPPVPPDPAAALPLDDRPGLVPWPAATPGDAAPAAAAPGDMRYSVDVTGLDDLRLDKAFRASSALVKGRGAPANLAQIDRRIAEDRELIDVLLRAQGYYGGRTTVTLAPGPPAAVTLAVDSGPLYRVSAVAVTVPDGGAADIVRAGLGVRAGDPLVAATVQAGQDGLKAYLAAHGHPFPTIAPPDIVVDHATRTATLTQAVDPGPAGVFGRVRGTGSGIVPPRELERLARFRPGQPYDAGQLDDLRRALIATGLVGAVTLTPVAAGPAPGGTEAIDIVVKTETAPLRTVAATLGYSTSQGVRAEASWQHRNLLPPNGQVTFRAVGAEREQLVGAELRRLNWRQRDLTLTLGATFDTATQDAFNARTLTFAASVARETNLIWQKKWYFSAGAETDISEERDKSAPGEPQRVYYIAAVPVSLTYDGSDNLLDPHRGFRLTVRASPELSFNGDIFGYMKLQGEASVYVPFGDRVTFAARGHAGTIAGAAQRDIAPTRRFYAGGGGSVRGFGFQAVGPQAPDGTPTGGDSIVEGSAEVRVRFGDFGVVPFFDAGEVDTSLLPRFRDVRYGGGIGFRYYTGFGPVRIDIA